MNDAAFLQGCSRKKQPAPQAHHRNLYSKLPVTVERSERAASPIQGRGAGGGETS